jgi:hypothetical protein
MKMLRATFVPLLVALNNELAAALPAAPNVTVVPLSTTCYDWPNWQNVRGKDITGAFTFRSDQTGDEGSNGLRVRTREYRDGSNATHSILVVDVRKSGLISPSISAYCDNGTVLFGYYGMGEKPPIVIDSSGAMKPEGTGLKLEPYAHEVNGVRQPGVFLGTRNQTTWGFDYIRPADCGALDFYYIWLQGLSSGGGREPMLLGFIKAEGL